jgi:hypothetical protein
MLNFFEECEWTTMHMESNVWINLLHRYQNCKFQIIPSATCTPQRCPSSHTLSLELILLLIDNLPSKQDLNVLS